MKQLLFVLAGLWLAQAPAIAMESPASSFPDASALKAIMSQPNALSPLSLGDIGRIEMKKSPAQGGSSVDYLVTFYIRRLDVKPWLEIQARTTFSAAGAQTEVLTVVMMEQPGNASTPSNRTADSTVIGMLLSEPEVEVAFSRGAIQDLTFSRTGTPDDPKMEWALTADLAPATADTALPDANNPPIVATARAEQSQGGMDFPPLPGPLVFLGVEDSLIADYGVGPEAGISDFATKEGAEAKVNQMFGEELLEGHYVLQQAEKLFIEGNQNEMYFRLVYKGKSEAWDHHNNQPGILPSTWFFMVRAFMFGNGVEYGIAFQEVQQPSFGMGGLDGLAE